MIPRPSRLVGLSFSLVLVAGLSGCATLFGSRPVQLTPVPAGDTITPLVCDPLAAGAPASVVDSIGYEGGPARIRIRYPSDDDPIAELVVPREAVSAPTIFTLSAPRATTAVYVDVVAVDYARTAVTTFNRSLTIVLYPQERNCRAVDTDPGLETYLYNIGNLPPPTGPYRSERDGEIRKGGELNDPWFGEARAGALVDGFSGFLIAQGRR